MYALAILVGTLVASLLAEHIAKKENLEIEVLWDGLLVLVISGLIGARAFFVIQNFQYFSDNPILIPQIWEGGAVILGAIILAPIITALYLKKVQQNPKPWLDLISITLPLGHAIGRLGNHFNNEHLPFAYFEMITNTLIFFIQWGLYSKKKVKLGTLTYLKTYLGLYGLIRLLLEPLREDSVYLYGEITTVHLICSTFIGASLLIHWAQKKKLLSF